MKKHSKISLLTTLAVSALACGIFSACNTTQEIVLQNFVNIEKTTELDSTYVLPVCNVTDTQGNDYPVSYSVKTADGAEIVVANNAFGVKLLTDYLITCTADLGDGDVRSRVITLKVEDKGLPEISFAEAKRGIEGMEYTLPSVTVSDSSKETITPSLKVFALNGEEKGAEQTVTDNKFTPNARGYYLLEATATDSAGNIAVESTKIFVREAPEYNEVVSFKYAEDVDCIDFNGQIDWLESYQSESGVAKLSYTGNQWANALCLGTLQDVSENSALYTTYDTLIVKMYIVQSSEITNYFQETDGQLRISQFTDGTGERNTFTSTNKIEYNKWINYAFDIQALKHFDLENPSCQLAKLWAHGVIKDGDSTIKHNGEFYIADVYCVNAVDVELSGTYQVGQTLTIGVSSGEAQYFVEKPDGTVDALQGDSYTITQKGKHKVVASSEEIYGETTFSAIRGAESGEVLSFDDADDLDYVYAKYDCLSLVDYADETGVLKINWNSSRYPTFSFQSLSNQSERLNYDYVTFRMYLQSGPAYENMRLRANAINKQPVDTTIVYDTWFDVRFKVSDLNNWQDGASAKELFDAQSDFYFTIPQVEGQTEYQAVIYIAEIRLEKKATVTVSGSTTVNGEIEFGATANSQTLSTSDAEIVVIAPNGTETTLTGATYTATEKGEHTVKITGANYYGETTFTVTREVGETELMSFNYEEDIDNVYVSTYVDGSNGETESAGGSVELVDSFEGETGVLKLTWTGKSTASGSWPAVAVSFLQRQAVYQNYQYVVFRVYTVEGLSNIAIQSGYKEGTSQAQNYYPTVGNTEVASGQWHDIKFTTSAFEKWTDDMSAQELWNARYYLYGTLASGTQTGTLYIADIYMSNE